jgi:hypothetical protein
MTNAKPATGLRGLSVGKSTHRSEFGLEAATLDGTGEEDPMMTNNICYAWRDDNNDWRFAVLTVKNSMGRGEIIFGTEDDKEGMLEPKLRSFLIERYGLTSMAVDQAVNLAKERANGPIA